MLPPRPYQQEAIDAVQSGWAQYRTQLLNIPTGGGKTVIFSHLAQAALPGRTLILAHRDELLDQAIEKLHRATGIFAQKEKAEHTASLQASVVVASVQTMARRLGKWPQDHFDFVVIDEAHHILAETYGKVTRHFSQARTLGVTATPDRTDRKNLGQFFERVAYEVQLFDLVHQGYLAPIRIRALPVEIDLAKVRKTAGDYNAADLGHAIEPYLASIASQIAQHAAFRRTLCFLPLIATSKAFVQHCKTRCLSAAHIDGDMHPNERRDILERFAAGEFDLLSNAMLLTEGFDDPGIDCVCILRPTQSRSLYSQMVGRGTRIAPGKRNLLLLDFLWLHEQHSLVRPAHLIHSGQSQDDDAEAALMTEKATGEQGEFDLEDLANEARRQREEKLRKELEEKAKRKRKEVDPLEFARIAAATDLANYIPETEEDARPILAKQRRELERLGIGIDGLNMRGQASKLIEVIQQRRSANLASPKQVKYLREFGHPRPETCTRDAASAFLDNKFGRTLIHYRATRTGIAA